MATHDSTYTDDTLFQNYRYRLDSCCSNPAYLYTGSHKMSRSIDSTLSERSNKS
jgi:hypothetical protein